MVAFTGVVVDDIQDDLDAGRVQRLDHPLELDDLGTVLAATRVLVVRREVADRVVTPVVTQAVRNEPTVMYELVHRHELDRGHPELRQVSRWPPDVRVRGRSLAVHSESLDVAR